MSLPEIDQAHADTLAYAYTYFRRLTKNGNPLDALWGEYYWRGAKRALASNGYKLRWDRRLKRHRAVLA